MATKSTSYDLTSEQLAVIRKLLYPNTMDHFKELIRKGDFSKRTIEAVLQGRRRNPLIINHAVNAALKELDRCNLLLVGID